MGRYIAISAKDNLSSIKPPSKQFLEDLLSYPPGPRRLLGWGLTLSHSRYLRKLGKALHWGCKVLPKHHTQESQLSEQVLCKLVPNIITQWSHQCPRTIMQSFEASDYSQAQNPSPFSGRDNSAKTSSFQTHIQPPEKHMNLTSSSWCCQHPPVYQFIIIEYNPESFSNKWTSKEDSL